MIEGHGDDGYAYPRIEVDFSSNVPPAADLQRYLISELEPFWASLTHYPPPRAYALEAALEARMELQAGSVLVTSGATEAIYIVAQWLASAYAKSTVQSYIVEPTFAEYASAACMNKHGVHHVLSLDDCPAHADAVWVCNPNNPTGRVYPPSKFRHLLTRLAHGYLILDTSYSYFTQEAQLSPSDAMEYPNLLMVGSMTKKYAMPGLRLGYIVASPSLIRQLAAFVKPWSVNPLAQKAGEILLNCPDHLLPNVAVLLEERKRMAERVLGLRNFTRMESSTHFMLLQWRAGLAADLKERLARQRYILIRNADNFYSLEPGCFRVSAQSSEENDRLLEALAQVDRGAL